MKTILRIVPPMTLDRSTGLTRAIEQQTIQITEQLMEMDKKLKEIINLLRQLVQK